MPEAATPVKAEGDRARRRVTSAAEATSGDPQVASAPIPASFSRRGSLPPDAPAQRYSASLQRLPSTALRQQFVATLGRQYGNAYLQRMLTPAAAMQTDDSRPTRVDRAASPLQRACSDCNEEIAQRSPTTAVDRRAPTTEEGVCPACGRRGRGTCACGRPFAPAQRAASSAIQREGDDSPGWADALLNRVRGDAASREDEVRGEAQARAGELENQGRTSTGELEHRSREQGAELEASASAQGRQLEQEGTAGAATVQHQAAAQVAQLAPSSQEHAAALQQTSAAATAELRGGFDELEGGAHAAVAGLEGELTGSFAELRLAGAASSGAAKSQVAAVGAQTTTQASELKAQTQSMVDERKAVVADYGTPGDHDLGAFQRRWDTLQEQVAAAEPGQAKLTDLDQTGATLKAQASATWQGLTGQAGQLVGQAKNEGGGASIAARDRWSGLGGQATTALGGLQQEATAAWTGLRDRANQVREGVRDGATSAWTRLRGRATAARDGFWNRASQAWTGLRGSAESVWSQLQAASEPAVSAVNNRVGGIIGSIQGALGGMASRLSGAVGSLVARVRQSATAAVDQLRARARAAVSAARQTGGQAWGQLQGLGTRAAEGLKGLGTRAWEGLRAAASAAVERLKDAAARIWSGLKSMGDRALAGLRAVWAGLKARVQRLWGWLEGALARLKAMAKKASDWIAAKAREARDWLRRQWEQIKSLARSALGWLREKWEWLKSKAKIEICFKPREVMAQKTLPPFQFLDGEFGPIESEQGLGGVQRTDVLSGSAKATLRNLSVGPISLRNMCILVEPLKRRGSGKAQVFVPATAEEDFDFKGSHVGTLNLSGLIFQTEGELKLFGNIAATATASRAVEAVYENGGVSLIQTIAASICTRGDIHYDQVDRVKAGLGSPPRSDGPGFRPIIPRPGNPLPPFNPINDVSAGNASTPAGGVPGDPSADSRPDRRLFELIARRWHCTRQGEECIRIRLQVRLGPFGGVSEGIPVDVDLDAEWIGRPESLLRELLNMCKRLDPALGDGAAKGGSGAQGDQDNPADQQSTQGRLPSGKTKDDPIEMDWLKPIEDYPTPIDLDSGRFSMRGKGRELPGTGEELGVDPAFLPAKDKLILKSGEDRPSTPKMEQFKNDLETHGFDWRSSKGNFSPDHVQDLAWRGLAGPELADAYNNLWPLDSALNEKAGRDQNQNQIVEWQDPAVDNDRRQRTPIGDFLLRNRFFKIRAIRRP